MKKTLLGIILIAFLGINAFAVGIVGTTKGKFTVEQGSANYSLKIDVPPGVAGMAPKLSLNYNSNDDNGYMGLGWSIGGTNVITRCKQTKAIDGNNHKHGVKYNRNDRFCLDGQRLIVVNGLPYGSDGAEYRTEIDTYAKIKSVGTYGGGPRYFNVYTKSGLRYIYGAKSTTFQYLKSGSAIKFWSVDRIIDTYGNKIDFFYKSNYTTGAHYLDKITYAGNTIQYVYENRVDVMKGYQAGYPSLIDKRLKTVIVRTGSTEVRRYTITYLNESTGAKRSKINSITERALGNNLEKLLFSYTSSGLNSFASPKTKSSEFGYLKSWTLSRRPKTLQDINGDGFPDIVGFGDAGVYVALNNKNGSFARSSLKLSFFGYSQGWRTDKHERVLQDVNGDSLPDIVGFFNQGVYVALNDGKGGFKPAQLKRSVFGLYQGWRVGKHLRMFADVNGDGYVDILGFFTDGVYVSLNDGKGGFGNSIKKSSSFGIKSDGYGWDMAKTLRMIDDVNGDGLPDIVGFWYDGVHIALNNGNGGFGASRLILKSFGFLQGWRQEKHIRMLEDVNGDGLSDIVAFGNNGVNVAINKGNGTFAPSSLKLSAFGYDKGGWRVNLHPRTMSDVNGDGFSDIVGFANAGTYVSLNNGKGSFLSPTKQVAQFGYTAGGWRTERHERILSDINGDGLPDIVGFGNNGVLVSFNNKKISHIGRITNNKDQDIKISYKHMSDPSVYYNYAQHNKRNAYPFNNIANDNIEMTSPIDLVYSVDRINAVGGYNRMRYHYYGYIYNKLRGSQGFHAIVAYDERMRTVDVTYYKQIGQPNGKGFQYTGMPYASHEGKFYDNTDSKYLKHTYITYKDGSSRSKTYEPYTYLNVQTIADPISQESIKRIYHYNYLSTDGLGNIEKVVNRTQDLVNNIDFYKTTINEYASEDKSKWHIGRLTKSTVTHSKTGSTDIVRVATFNYNAQGVLSKEIANVGTPVALAKSYSYDSHGNKISETIDGIGVPTASTHYTYSSDGKFKTGVTNAEGLSESYTYDARFGVPLTHTGPNGLTTTWTYDALGRKIEEQKADGTWRKWTHSWTADSKINTRSVFSVTNSASGTAPKVTIYDSLGRVTQAYTHTLGGKKLYTAYKVYDAKAHVVKEALPYLDGDGSIGYIKTTYDKYGRITSVSKPGPSNTQQTYSTSIDKFTTIVTDPKGNQKQTIKNAKGQVTSITDAYGTALASSITYNYDAIGNLLTTTDSAGNVIRMAYNAAGKKVYMNDPDLGVWNYTYNALGKMTSQTNQQGQTTSISYDILGRMIYKRVDENTSFNETSYLYSGAGASVGSRGKLIKTTNTSALNGTDQHSEVKTMTYDSLGRPTQTLTSIGGRGDYVTKVNYDAYSRPLTLTYPNDYAVTNHYDPTTGILDSVIGSDGVVHYKIDKLNAFGSITNATYGNGIHTLIAHDNAGYTGSIISYGASALLGGVQRLDYSYDALGNVVSREDNSIAGKNILDTYSYDAMNRLASQNTVSDVIGNYAKSKVYQYDSLGNITFQTGIGAYTYYADKPHAVKSAGTRNYTYDSVGNMVNRNGDSIVYNPLNKPAILTNHKTGAEVRFYYGAGGKRYMKRTANTDTYYLGKSYEERVTGSQEKQICYISLGGKTIGTHTQVLNTDYVTTNPNYAETPFTRYFHTDALGSITAITDENGTVVERRSYDAFGKIRAMDYGTNDNSLLSNLTIETTRAFTGHEQIGELSGLVHMNARVYDSDIGRFLSADSIVQDPLDSQAFNRYSYVRNNPMMFTDPSGHSWLSRAWKKVKRAWKKVVGAVLIIVGVFVALSPIPGAANIGASIAGAGVSLYNYDKTGKFEFQAPIIETGGGGKGKNPAEQQEQIDAIQDEEVARAETLSGTQNNLGASSDNGKYANGASTGSQGHTGASQSYTESNGEITLNPIIVTPLSQEYYSTGDVLDFTYEALTFIPIVGVLDVGYQYYNDDISGWYAAGLVGLSLVPGGRAGAKGVSYAFTSSESLFYHFGKHGGNVMDGLKKTDYNVKDYLNDANYIINTGQYLPDMNGYIKFMGKDGKANYGFVGMTRDGKNITTFGVRSVKGLRGL